MNAVIELLLVASIIGAIDVGYYHIYKYRLFEQPSAVGEHITHLLRSVMFLAIGAVVTLSDGSPAARAIVLGLVAFDLLNGVVDVLLERRSRKPMGGLPTGEYLLHILGSFVIGLAVATFWWQSSSAGFVAPELSGLLALRLSVAAVIGVAILLAEGGLFARAIWRRSSATEPASVLSP